MGFVDKGFGYVSFVEELLSLIVIAPLLSVGVLHQLRKLLSE